MEPIRAREIADSFKIRGSATHEIVAGEMGLTDKQKETVATYTQRLSDFNAGIAKVKDLTDKQKDELATLLFKRDNPQLPEGAKTHCKKWLKHNQFGRWPELKNKYVEKGNKQEEEGFTIMALQLNLGMVYKNTQRLSNEYSIGECDLDHNKVGYDNKCSYDLSTFPMFEFEIPDDKYWWQLQNYNINWPHWEKMCLCYTLVDSSETEVKKAIKWTDDQDEIYRIVERMIYIKLEFERLQAIYFPLSTLSTFTEIPEENRIKTFYFEPSQEAKNLIKERAYMCKEYIYNLLIKSN